MVVSRQSKYSGVWRCNGCGAVKKLLDSDKQKRRVSRPTEGRIGGPGRTCLSSTPLCISYAAAKHIYPVSISFIQSKKIHAYLAEEISHF